MNHAHKQTQLRQPWSLTSGSVRVLITIINNVRRNGYELPQLT